MGISNLNKGSVFDIDTTDFDFYSLNDLKLNKDYLIKGVYILTKRGKMRQDMPNVILTDCIVNLPSHLLEDVKTILNTPEYIEQIKNDKCAINVYTYQDENGEHRSIKWVDIE